MSETIEEIYQKNHVDYSRFCENIVAAIVHFLTENNIPFLNVSYRIKDMVSIKEKIRRKNYLSPPDQIEDICGIRIICYYTSDIEKIRSIIVNEFEVLEQEDKAILLNSKEFGYRSNHFIVKINQQWASAPNYRKLENYKAEIQVRTVLMHAWAEIEHKLNYKSKEQIPETFRRKLYRLSAKFEEADEQFEDLKETISVYISNLTNTITQPKKDISTLEFNLNSYQSYLELRKEKYSLNRYNISRTFDHLLARKVGFKHLDAASDYAIEHGDKIIENFKGVNYYKENDIIDFIELLYFSIDILFPKLRSDRHRSASWIKALEQWKNNGS